jgi:hypothetical protein
MRHSLKGMHMQRKTLTLKSVSNADQSQPTPSSTDSVVNAGRRPKSAAKSASTALLSHLQEMVDSGKRIFIQMRHGAGYFGFPAELTDGWLTMKQVSIHGTKKALTVPHILIQISDGSFIAHIHPADSSAIGASK